MKQSILDLDVFLASDLSQAEVRMLAEISGDPILVEQFRNGEDIHCQVGSMLTGWTKERIAKEKAIRKAVKNLHFGLIFGKGRGGIYDYIVMKIRQLEGRVAAIEFMKHVSRKQVEGWYDQYFRVYKNVARYVEDIRKFAVDNGYVESLFQFRRWINENDETRDTYTGNQAINSPIQSSAHGFILIALALLHLQPRTYSLLQRCLMEVHDALYFRVKLRHLPEAYKQLMYLLETGTHEYAKQYFKLDLQVPLIAEASAGFCMGAMPDYHGEPIEEFLVAWRKKQREVASKPWEELVPIAA